MLPQAAKLPGTSGFLKNSQISANSSAPSSEAARGKWLRKQKIAFQEKVLPQAAKLPGTSGFFKKKLISEKQSSAPGNEAARDKWLLQKKSGF